MSISIPLPGDIAPRFSKAATQTGRSKTNPVAGALLQHAEDAEDLALAERELLAVRAGQSQTASLEEVMKRYGLEG